MSLFGSFDNDYSHFTFTYRCNGKDVTVNLDKQDATVPQVLEEFMNFMKACGYCFDIDDRFDVVNDFKYPTQNSEQSVDEYEAEAKAYEQAADGSVTFKVPNTWVEYNDKGEAKEYTSYPGFNYKSEDY